MSDVDLEVIIECWNDELHELINELQAVHDVMENN